jgi:hypothetical protein
VVVEDRGWVPDGAYGARLIVVAPVGGLGFPPEVHTLLDSSGQKHDARSELGVPASGYRAPDPDAPPPDPAGLNSNHPGGPRSG